MAVDPNWSPVEDLSFVPPNSEQIAVVATGGGVHLVWTQAKTLYHARRADGAWSGPVRLASGEQPALAAAADGVVYCAFANWFLGNREIYVASFAGGKWTLPELVSRTTGASSDPAICAAPDGAIRVVWADATPGYSTIYHATRSGGAWANGPIPNGKGSRPTVAAGPAGVDAAWQDRLAGTEAAAFDVLAGRLAAGEWGLPDMVSDTRDAHSILPRIAVSAQGHCHLVWQDERDGLYVIRHADRWPNGWAAPVDVSDPQADARLAAILPNKWGQFQVVWSEGALLRHRVRPGEPQSEWKPAETACEECEGLSELAAAISESGELHAVFTKYANGDRRAFYVRRKAIERQKVFLPVVTK